MSEYWVPIILIISFAIVFTLMLFFTAKAKKDMQVTLRQMLEQGHEINPELLSKMGEQPAQPMTDLRRSILLISVGLACLVAGTMLNQFKLALAIGVFPTFIGLAFLISGIIERDKT